MISHFNEQCNSRVPFDCREGVCRETSLRRSRKEESRMAVIQNSTVLSSAEGGGEARRGRPLLSTEKSSPEPLKRRRRPRPLSFPSKTRGWLYLGSPVEAAPISEARYTTFYRRGIYLTQPLSSSPSRGEKNESEREGRERRRGE